MNRRKIVKKITDFKKIVFGVWFGEEMSPVRKRCLLSLEENFKKEDIQFVLITEKNLSDYPKIKLHEGFKYLSEVHKSDYIRTALMHFYGGGYTDIKMTNFGWNKAFIDLYNSDKFGNGYTEVSREGVAVIRNRSLYKEMTDNYHLLLGNGNYIFKKDTPLTREWYSNMINLMNERSDTLKNFPAKHARQNLYIEDRNYSYPIGWTELLGCIFHPLCLKYSSKLLHTCPKFKKEDYL